MYDDVPKFINDFINYMISIKNRSRKTTNEYYYDLRDSFRFLKLYKSGIKLSKITNDLIIHTGIVDLDLKFVREIELEDLYEYLTFLSERAFGQSNN